MKMEKGEQTLLVAVFVCALVFSAFSLQYAQEHFALRATATAPAGGAGQPRDADIETIKRLIRQGELSDHEALFYTPAPTLPDTPR
jgi:hypothetical protein